MINREAVILIAGMGTRLMPLTADSHKCLTEVNGVPILENMLRILEQEGFSKAVLVVGYLKELICGRIGDRFGNMKIEYAENNRYKQTNTSYSLKLGIEKICGDGGELFVLEGDVFFEKKLMDDFIEEKLENAALLEKYRTGLDGTFVDLDEDGYVTAWIHKSRRMDGYDITDKYKTVNIHKFSSAFVRNVLYPYLTESVRVSEGREPLEYVMHRIVSDDPEAVKGAVLHGQKWIEIDDLDDLKRAKTYLWNR